MRVVVGSERQWWKEEIKDESETNKIKMINVWLHSQLTSVRMQKENGTDFCSHVPPLSLFHTMEVTLTNHNSAPYQQ